MVTINGADYEECANGMLLGHGGKSSAGWHDIESYIRCPKEHQFKIARGIRRPIVQTPDPLGVGSLLHAGRARWFGDGCGDSEADWQRIHDTVTREALIQTLPVSTEATRLALQLLQGYVSHYKRLALPRPIACEYLLGPTLLGENYHPATARTARLDDVSYYAEAGGLAIGEVKTTSGKISDVIKTYSYHGQTMMQQLLWSRSPYGERRWGPVRGTVLDVVCKRGKSGRPEYAREFITFTDWQLEQFADSMAYYSAKQLAVTKDSNERRNFSACMRPGAFGPAACEYLDLCKYGREVAGEYVLEDGKSLRTWNPESPISQPPWS